jgi:hypothetical protein
LLWRINFLFRLSERRRVLRTHDSLGASLPGCQLRALFRQKVSQQ